MGDVSWLSGRDLRAQTNLQDSLKNVVRGGYSSSHLKIGSG